MVSNFEKGIIIKIKNLSRERVARRLKFLIFIPRGITKKPRSSTAVISDLFLIRGGNDWNTEFELLNIRGIVEGDNRITDETAKFVFFDPDGREVSRRDINLPAQGRTTIKLSELFGERDLGTFSIFHSKTVSWLSNQNGYLADRGYTGYEYKGLQVKGYVHGNLDATALDKNDFEMLGQSGFVPRTYNLQHVLRGPATYQFAFVNPTKKKVKLKARVSGLSGEKFNKHEKHSLELNSRASRIVSTTLKDGETAKLSVRSRLYMMGRPVVFRVADQTMDVFHG